MTPDVHPVDERLPHGKLAALGLQHVLVMYAGAVAVPLIVGRAHKLSPEQVAMANSHPGTDGAGLIFGSIIGAGVISILIAPLVSRMLRFFPPVVTGTIIAVIGISLMRIGINWIFGNPFGPTAPSVPNPEHLAWLEAAKQAAANGSVPPVPQGMAIVGSAPNPKYAQLSHIGIAAIVLVSILLIAKSCVWPVA